MNTNIKCLVVACAALLSTACVKTEVEELPVKTSEGVEITITAVREGLNPDTKTVRKSDGSVEWCPLDEISVFYTETANGGSKFTSQNTEQAAIAEFKGQLDGFVTGGEEFTEGKYLYGVYPYSAKTSFKDGVTTISLPSHQTAAEGTFANGLFPTIARAQSVNLAFYNICGGVKFTVSRDDITSISFKGNNGERIAGSAKVIFDDTAKPAVLDEEVESKSEITVYAPAGGTFKAGKEYFIVAYPAKLTSGFTMTFQTSAMKEGQYVSKNSVEIRRSVFGVLRQADKNVTSWTDSTNGGGGESSGIYLGIVGFNQQLYSYPIKQLTNVSKPGFGSFIDDLNMRNGTLLYYSVDQAINTLQSVPLPADLSTAAIVTFTDGLDQGSMMMDVPYSDNTEYLDALNHRIMNETVSRVPITAYSIGIRGQDVTDVTMFRRNLAKLASSSENATEVTSMSEVNAKFKEVAEQLSKSSYVQTINLTIPGLSNGTRVRFTFDNVSSAGRSNLYIEGTFNLADRSLENVKYYGLESTSGTTVKGVVDGIFVTFTFEGVHTNNNVLIDNTFTDEWTYISSNNTWQINSEFDKTENSDIITERYSAVIMLVLDCSSSLADDFATAQNNAKDFINTLYEAVGGDSAFGIITADFDPAFAQELQKRGYIADANNITLEEVKGITRLDVSGEWNYGTHQYDGKLTSLRGIEYFESLTTLYCYGNQLTALDMSKNTALKELSCSYNQLTTLDVSKNTTLTSLLCYGNQLTTLDVSKNTALTTLYCYSNRLATLDVSGCSALTYLPCYDNQLTTLDVSKNTALTHLRCYNNRLTTLDVSGCSALTYLQCYDNRLATLDVSNNMELIYLYCYGNPGDGAVFPVTTWFDNNNIPNTDKFTTGSWEYNGKNVRIDYRKADTYPSTGITADFDPVFAYELQKRGYIADAKNITLEEVKGITRLVVSDGFVFGEHRYEGCGKLSSLRGIEYFESLTFLECGGNQLTTLNVSKNTALKELWCYANQLTTLDVSKNTALKELNCSDNPLTTLDVSNNTALTSLYCYRNQLNTLDVSNNTALTSFGCLGNQLTTLDVSKNTALKKLRCYENQLTTLDVSKNKALIELDCKNNPGDGSVFPVTAWFDNNSIPNSDFTTGSWNYNGNTVRIDYRKANTNPGTDITADFDPAFAQELQKRGYIADANNITLEEVKGITELNVSGKWVSSEKRFDGELTSLRGIEYFESLTNLYCSYNRLTTLDVSKNTVLEDLRCNKNQLTTLDVSKNTALAILYCENNQLTTLDVSKNTALKELYCGSNQLTTLDVSKNTALTRLICYYNQLTTLDVSKNTALTTLYCYNNRLTTLDVSNNTVLTYLGCQLTTLDVSKNTALKYLDCRYGQLTTLDVSKNMALTSLDCAYNKLPTLDVSKNTALTELDCEENPGDGSVFPVKAWFDNNSIPNSEKFTTGSWTYNGKTVRIDYRKAK